MTTKSFTTVVEQLRKLAAAQADRDCPDHDLLQRFVHHQDSAAFTALVERHGPMVVGVCRRALGHRQDAEDVCQATFLVLARKAATIRQGTALAGWLHKIACCVAANLTRERARRRRREHAHAPRAAEEPAAQVSWREVQALLDEELERLPERYRAPLILCYLEGRTRDEAARQLGLSAGTLHGCLERGRHLLRLRLTQRGLTLSAALFATALGTEPAAAALPPALVVSSARAALVLAAGQPLPANAVPGPVCSLTEEVLKTMFLSKLKMKLAAGVVLCAALALAVGLFASTGAAQNPKKPVVQMLAETLAPAETDEDFIKRVSKDLRGTEPTPTEIHFFTTSKDLGKRQKLIDLFIQERQARHKGATEAAMLWLAVTREAHVPATVIEVMIKVPTLDSLQKQFYEELQAAKDRDDVARVTQAHLDRLVQFVKGHPKNEDAPQAALQIIRVYQSQGKEVEAGAWRDKLRKEYPDSAAARAVE
jgi:RNA polymerase sigma factor (sigma-70 family)